MSWQLASLVAVAAVLASGFAWYERSRPPAKVIALVGALAALATIGRIAFAPFPNVKPTSDIALFAGYALGSAPGFAVGAVAALVSNFFFGQGPWTPWQMFAWGFVGVGGAVLARIAGRELGRVPLAVACGLAGAGFGMIMDAYQWTLGARQDLAHYLAVSTSSLGFNLAHVIGNVVFCLALGPPFVRALERYRRRFEVNWSTAAARTVLVFAALLVIPALTRPADALASAGSSAVSYLEGAQNGDGGFGGAPGESSTQLDTGWVALGLEAADVNPGSVSRGGHSMVDYIRANAGELTATGDLERTILVLEGAGLSPHSFAGRDFVSELKSHQAANGSFGASVNLTAFGALALRAVADPGAQAAGNWLAGAQDGDGGFGFAPHGVSDVDDTGAVLEALGATGKGPNAAVGRALDYLRGAQDGDGGFPQESGEGSNAQSTAWAVQGLIAVGVSPSAMTRGGDPVSYLESLQASDGSIHYSRASNQTPVWVTAEALDAIEGRAFPIYAAGSGGHNPSRSTDSNHRGPRRGHGRTGHHAAAARRHADAAAASATGGAGALRRDAQRGRGSGGRLGMGALVAIIVGAIVLVAAFLRWWYGPLRIRRGRAPKATAAAARAGAARTRRPRASSWRRRALAAVKGQRRRLPRAPAHMR